MKRIIFILSFGLFLILLLIGCGLKNIPEKFTYRGTNYVNCHPNTNIPNSADNIVTLSSEVKEEIGSRQAPYWVIKISDVYLFESNGIPLSGGLGSGNEELVGEKIAARGYRGKANITVSAFTEEGPKEVTLKTVDALFVTEIEGWQNICCDATLENTDQISTPNACRWFSMKDFNSQIDESNKGIKKIVHVQQVK